MNEILGSNIVRLRKEAGMTQEQLANALGISYQAVSKWENGVSCPDISTLPLLADLFSVSIDSLFGRETVSKPAEETPVKSAPAYPWPDDNTLYAVLFRGHTYIGSGSADDTKKNRIGFCTMKKRIEFCYEGPALNIRSDFAVNCEGDVEGNIEAGGSVTCNDVGGDVKASGSVTCDSVKGHVNASGSVTCDNVAGNVQAGGSVSCDDIGGSVTAGTSVNCDSVKGDVHAAAVQCDEISGGIFKMR